MPRPPKANGTRTRRDEILDEATRLFAERGYEGASMADLADAVGMRKASLFYHFASKEVLYSAVIERLTVAFRAAIEEAVRTEGPYEDRLDALTSGIVGVLGTHPHAARLMVREVMDWGPVVRGSMSESMMALLEGAKKFMIAGQNAGAFSIQDPSQLILSVLGIYFLPFAVTGLADRFIERNPAEPAPFEARMDACRRHVRVAVLARHSAPPVSATQPVAPIATAHVVQASSA